MDYQPQPAQLMRRGCFLISVRFNFYGFRLSSVTDNKRLKVRHQSIFSAFIRFSTKRTTVPHCYTILFSCLNSIARCSVLVLAQLPTKPPPPYAHLVLEFRQKNVLINPCSLPNPNLVLMIKTNRGIGKNSGIARLSVEDQDLAVPGKVL